MRNEVKEQWKALGLPIGSYIHIAGLKFDYGATSKEIIDPDAILKMYEDEEITREQYLSMITVNKKPASTVLGGDLVAQHTIETVGDKADIRMEALPVEQEDEEFVYEKDKAKTKRKTFGKNKVKAGEKAKPRRRIKVRK